MNRHERRAAAARAGAAKDRGDAIWLAADYLTARNDPTITGGTLILPDGTSVYLDAAALRRLPARWEDMQ